MRIDCEAVLPDATRALRELDRVAGGSGLEPRLLELVRMRVSQLNNCAYCLDMHSKAARALGEDEQRLHLLATWRDAHIYGARERTALDWCEALTLLPDRGASHDAYFPLKAEFANGRSSPSRWPSPQSTRGTASRSASGGPSADMSRTVRTPRPLGRGRTASAPARTARRFVGCVMRRRCASAILVIAHSGEPSLRRPADRDRHRLRRARLLCSPRRSW